MGRRVRKHWMELWSVRLIHTQRKLRPQIGRNGGRGDTYKTEIPSQSPIRICRRFVDRDAQNPRHEDEHHLRDMQTHLDEGEFMTR